MPGRPHNKLHYLSEINEVDFPFLIADILVGHFNHTSVKVVDGTGDGKRDVFSINPQKEKVITQCKFHYDFNKTSGSKETDEIVLALSKFGCANGIFCTSGKLSPQSKREYLDNYPDFTLTWLEGHEIVDIVLENTVLRKIWFEKEKIHRLSNSISVPFIVRQLPDDVDFPITTPFEIKLNDGTDVTIKEKSIFKPNQFRPFNNLDIRNSGSHFGNVFAFEALLLENAYFNSIDGLKTKILETILCSISNPPKSYIAIRFGIPHFSEDDNFYRNYKVEKSNFPINSETFILKDKVIISEFDFLIDLNSDWKRLDRIHMSQLSNFCFYNKVHDLALFIYYKCDAQKDLHPYIIQQIEVNKIIWKKSLFLSGASGICQYFKDFPPDKLYSYGPNAELACWIHPQPFMYSADMNQFEQELFDEDFEKLKRKLIKLASSRNLEKVEWEKASKIAALNDDDPFPSNPQTSYRIVDILEDFHTVPSPIKPENREFIFECVWIISYQGDQSLSNKINKFTKKLIKSGVAENVNFTIDDETNEIVYMRVTYTPNFIAYLSTDENIKLLTTDVCNIFNRIETHLTEVFSQVKRATNSYWLAELGVFLDWSESH